MRYRVALTEDALRDLDELDDFIAANDSPGRAEYVVERILEAVRSLERFPERGVRLRELLALGVTEYRQVTFKHYRVIYRVVAARVYVYLIADGRRDMEALLARRLVGG